MLRDAMSVLADVLTTEIGAALAADGIDAEIAANLVTSPSEAICLDIYPAPTGSRQSDEAAFGDLSGFYVLTVRARVSVTESGEGQAILLDMIDDSHDLSVAAAVESDGSLNGYATDVFVDADGFSGLLEFGTNVVGCTWRVLVGVAVS